jgi:hypothetical protein
VLLLRADELLPDMTSKDLAFWLWGASMLQLLLPAPLLQACCCHGTAQLHDMTAVTAVSILHGLARQRQLRRQALRAGQDGALRKQVVASTEWPGKEQQPLVLELLGLLQPRLASLSAQQLSSVVLSVTELSGLNWQLRVKPASNSQSDPGAGQVATGTSQPHQQQPVGGSHKAAATLEPPMLQHLPAGWLAELLAAVEQHSAARDVAADRTWSQTVSAAGALQQRFCKM